MEKIKIAFICVHNSCRSQMAEAFGKKYLSEKFECYSAGTETKPAINADAVRIMKEHFGIDMTGQYSKLIADIPTPDIVITMGCNVKCPYMSCKERFDWGLDDPTGKSDEHFIKTAGKIKANILSLRG
ncbi:MAG: arsenate reductase ArsC [Clostridia bacterium]|nr:arsenate reductase ArsC [Clostridia bacterium]